MSINSDAGDERPSRGPGEDITVDAVASLRDQAARVRDDVAEQEDQAADLRDLAAVVRDRTAEARDQAAAAIGLEGKWTVDRQAQFLREIASDRVHSARDRVAAADERRRAKHDRRRALGDREAAAKDREHASVDRPTGALVRDAGLAQLGREIARSRRTKEPLIVAIVDIDSSRVVKDVHGHTAEAGDRMLADLVMTLRTNLRSYDLIIRYGSESLVCAILGMDMSGAAKWLERVENALPQHSENYAVSVGFAELQPSDSTDDLLSRAVTALHRGRRQTGGRTWECGALVVDEKAWTATRAGSPLCLTATEFRILVELARNHTHVVPKRQLINRLGGYGNDFHLLEVHICSLRRKLEVCGPRVIFTVRGVGYVLRS